MTTSVRFDAARGYGAFVAYDEVDARTLRDRSPSPLCTACWLLASGCRQAPVDNAGSRGAGPGRHLSRWRPGRGRISPLRWPGRRKEKKRVLLDFGGNWCGDCQVLEIYFHDPANRSLLEANYVLVPVNIGRYDENLDIAATLWRSGDQRSACAGRARCPAASWSTASATASLRPCAKWIRLR